MHIHIYVYVAIIIFFKATNLREAWKKLKGGTWEEERGKGVENALGTVLVETKAHSACEEERLTCSKCLEGTYVLNVSISPVRLIRSVRLTSTFSLSFSSSC